jgi:hypothetical protein
MIGRATGTGTGKVTWLGSAKPDDPVFKEGWSISIVPQSRQKSPEPSSSTLDKIDAEADKSENVMRDPMTGEAIRCRYCNSADVCPHVLFLINWDFPGDVEGYCANRWGQFRELVQAEFLPRLQGGTGSKWVWSIRELNELWDFRIRRHREAQRAAQTAQVLPECDPNRSGNVRGNRRRHPTLTLDEFLEMLEAFGG